MNLEIINLSKLKSLKINTKLTLFGTLTIVVSSYVLLKWLKLRRCFKKMNVPSAKPYPLFGNLVQVAASGVRNYDKNLIEKHGKVVGYYEGDNPVVLCTDVQLLKNVLIKDFHCFVNRRTIDGILVDPLDKFLTVLKDDEWKNVRSIVSATFSTGKLKLMSKAIIGCADVVVDHIKNNNENVDVKEMAGCFSMDVISCCCFGVYVDSINNPNNEFIKYLKKFFKMTFILNMKFLFLFLAPTFAKFLSKKNLISFMPDDAMSFLRNISEEVLRKRRAKEERRDDFIQIMVDHEEEKLETNNAQTNVVDEESNTEQYGKNWKPLKKRLTNSEILSQSLVFMVAGYDSTSTVISLTLYNLAIHPECQERLYNEVQDAINHHGNLNYDLIHELVYMDMVVNETMRMYPIPRLDRVCGEDYDYKDKHFPKGTIITCPIWALHYDPDLYPSPEKFDPERFSPEMKQTRESVAFLPFGAGPRNCVASRFALLEVKVFIAKVLMNYEVQPCAKTQIPLVMDKGPVVKPEKPILLNFKNRQ